MLDSVFVHRHALLATVVLQTTQPVAAASKVVQVTGVKVAAELDLHIAVAPAAKVRDVFAASI